MGANHSPSVFGNVDSVSDALKDHLSLFTVIFITTKQWNADKVRIDANQIQHPKTDMQMRVSLDGRD